MTRCLTNVAVCLVAIVGCSKRSLGTDSSPTQPALPVFVGVTNESELTRRVELRINNVVVIDTVVAEPLNVTGRVLAHTIRLAPGTYELILVDHLSKRQFGARLDARPGPMCIFISLMRSRTEFRAGNYVCGFA